MQDIIQQIGDAAQQLRDALSPLQDVANSISNGVIALFTIVLAAVSWRQGRIANRALKATQLTAEASKAVADTAALADRPWITLEATVNKPLKFEGRVPHIGVGVSLKNIGRTPATNVEITGRLVPHFHPDSEAKLEKLIQSLTAKAGGRGWPETSHLQGHTMFPGEVWQTDQYYYPQIQEVDESFKQDSRSEFDLSVIIVVGYVSAIGSIHYTYFRSRVRIHPFDERMIPLVHGRANGEIPPENVALEIHGYGNRDRTINRS